MPTRFPLTAIAGVVAECVLLHGAAKGQAPFFQFVGISPGSLNSQTRGLSADGSVAVGYGNSTAGYVGFRWTLPQGRQDYGSLGLPPDSKGLAISGDGATLVGDSTLSSSQRAYRWNQLSGVFDNLGVVPTFTRSQALGVSGDGEVVVGVNTRNQPGVSMAFRWTEETGMQALGYTNASDFQSEARAVSRDGSTIVGFSSGASTHAFAWTSDLGLTVLPELGPGFAESVAFGVNHDGSIIVGRSTGLVPVAWIDGAVTPLGLPTGFQGGYGLSVADTGSIVVGQVQSVQGARAAAVWQTIAGGAPQLLTDYLLAHGVTLPSGLNLSDCYAVSADGLTFAGVGSLPGGPAQGFVAHVPAPASAALVLGVGVVAHSRRRRW